MPPILLNILTILMAVSFTSAAWTDLFDPLFRSLDYGPPDYDEEFDYVKRGKCTLSGCTRPPNRVCSGPLITLFPTRTVNDLNRRNVTKWKKGVKNCARLCRDEGELDDGTFACESFNYRYNKTSSGAQAPGLTSPIIIATQGKKGEGVVQERIAHHKTISCTPRGVIVNDARSFVSSLGGTTTAKEILGLADAGIPNVREP